jgi:hypothetical protein
MPMLVPDRAASMFGEPTPSTIAPVGACAVRDCTWERSGTAKPNARTALAISLKERLDVIE